MQVSGLQQATRNAQDGISVVQTAEGALSSVQSMLQRIHDLVDRSRPTPASSDSTARQAAQNEIVQLRNEIDRVGNTTSFGNQHLLDGSFGAQAAHARRRRRPASAAGSRSRNTATRTFTLEHRLRLRRRACAVDRHGHAGTYATAASFQAELQTDVNAATDGHGRLHRLGHGQRDATSAPASGRSSSSATAPTRHQASTVTRRRRRRRPGDRGRVGRDGREHAGGVFQVGANVTANEPDPLSISDIRITGGTDGAFTALAEHRRDRHRAATPSAADPRRRRAREVSNAAGSARCGAEPLPVHHLQPAGDHGRTSPLRRAASVDTDMASRWSTSPRTRSSAGRYRHARPGERGPADHPEAPPVSRTQRSVTPRRGRLRPSPSRFWTACRVTSGTG